MQFAHLLDSEAVETIHEAALEILESVGILVHNPKAREVFAKNGCRVDSATGAVFISRAVIASCRSRFVPTFTFRARDPERDRTIPDERPIMVTASSAPNIIDPVSGKERRATSDDIANIAFLVNALDGYDVFSISTLAGDAPPNQFSLSRFYPALKNCTKPIRGNTPDMQDLMDVIELGEIIAGGRSAYRERPLITHHCCPVISPLTMDMDSTETLIHLVQEGLPIYGTIVPNAGLTAPMSLVGALALGNAEFLALAALMQMIRPGTPMIYAVLSTVADLRNGAYTPGAIETGMLQMAHAQMARYYKVPSGGYIGLTNAHVNDAQAGYETGMNTTAAVLGGADMLNMGGLLDSLMAFDFGKAVTDSEIACMLKQLNRFPAVNSDRLQLDLIRSVGPGGSYLETAHTLAHMKDTALLTRVAEREMRATWESMGGSDTQVRALSRAAAILKNDNPAVFSKETDQRIRERFAGLVKGDAAAYPTNR